MDSRHSTSSYELNNRLNNTSSNNGFATTDPRTDDRDMLRLGKKQEFKRTYNFISTLGFTSIYMATWEFVLVSMSGGLINGGFGGLFWVFVGTVICYGSVVASLAELASMAPTSGGQYHWVSEYAPASWQKIASYATGNSFSQPKSATIFLTLKRMDVNASLACLPHIFRFHPHYSRRKYLLRKLYIHALQSTLLMLLFLLLTLIFNTYLATFLPAIETCSLFGHLGGFVLVIVPLLYFAPKKSASEVFTQVVNNGGWGNKGTSCMVSQVAVLFCCIGSDSAVHMSEEVEDASLVVPQAVWYSYLLNITMGFIMLITMLFCIGDLNTAILTSAPYIQLFKNTGSDSLATALMIFVFILIYLGNISALATTSREIWAFSRDSGFPFSNWTSRVHPRTSIPTNSILLTTLASSTLCLINLLFPLFFTTISSLTLLALLSTYILSISLVLRKRFLHEPLPEARWSLGKYGGVINAFAVAYCAWVFVWACFPATLPVTRENANWAPVVWVAVIGVAALGWFGHGRLWYTPPVVRKGDRGGYVELVGLE